MVFATRKIKALNRAVDLLQNTVRNKNIKKPKEHKNNTLYFIDYGCHL